MKAEKPAPHAQQERKQPKQREEHHITLDVKIFADCISPLLLLLPLQLIQICHLEQVKKEISISTPKASAFCLTEKKSLPNVEISIQTLILLQFRFILLVFFLFCPSPLLQKWARMLSSHSPKTLCNRVSCGRKWAPALPSPGSKPAPPSSPIFGIKAHDPGVSASCRFYLHAKHVNVVFLNTSSLVYKS